jgi:hypothetical protein
MLVSIFEVRWSMHGGYGYLASNQTNRVAPMHALPILHRCLSPLLSHIHARRLVTLFEAVIGSVCGPALSLTDLGRRFKG